MVGAVPARRQHRPDGAGAAAPSLSKALGQSVIISNKGGAAGTIGLLDLVRAEPDGYTTALTPNNPITAQPHMQPDLRFGTDTPSAMSA